MTWNEQEARKRIRESYKETAGLTRTDLVKEMDLHELALNDCKNVKGVHLYLDVTNFADELDAAKADKAKLKKLLRDVNVYERLMRDLLRDTPGSVRVHFQGVRLHAVFHKPYDTQTGAATERLNAANTFVAHAKELAELLSESVDRPFDLEAGLECGDTIAAVNGQVGARELMFVGDAANVAAKILTGKPGTRLGAEALKLTLDTPTALPAKWQARVDDEVKAHPIDSFETYQPTDVAIDYEALGLKTADLVPGATFFADVKGFTKHINSLKTDAEKVEALRSLHVVRSEMHQIAARQYAGDFLQYQGDRIQTIHYEAKGSRNWAKKVIEAAAAMARAFEIFEEELPDFSLGVTMGAAAGRTFVTKVGVKGDRDLIALGSPVSAAAALQDGVSTSGAIAINAELYTLLGEDEKEEFTKVGEHYEASVKLKKLLAKEEGRLFDANRPLTVTGDMRTGRSVAPSSTGARPAKSYLPK